MLRLVVILLWLPMVAFAQTYPEPLTDTVSDYANLLPPDAEARVSAALQAGRDETGVHIVLATITAQADYGGTGRFADFATGWFNAWAVGDRDRNDGILILVGTDDRETRIVLGHGYGVIWDGRAQRVIDTAMLPAFRDGVYAKGLEDGVQMAIDQLARPFAAQEIVTEDSGFPQPGFLERYGGWIFGGLFVSFFAWLIFGQQAGRFIARWERCPQCGNRNMYTQREVTIAAEETIGGQGIEHRRCRSCQYDRERHFATPSLAAARKTAANRNTRSGSSSGFGGGSSGGGGASGKW
ncbi:YgcG family protein [Pseudorhodobacter sp.]|uniref:TPM domain-containing protein n=1 Tax=Pseudorhodobacter sp. TaxID=1934400 RepID=UPI002647CDAF|nr:TPM domain-containing protein [Pseudorhodobacter sp.]MDN5786089.1 TPM domain-containing protein [Pseudorhodobacter sp.]